ncbi:MAG: hypothetical protein LC731_01925, partial [Acidobacteria bacterium]|nr:hypothetical protein [Acidobacteriota bacterium]
FTILFAMLMIAASVISMRIAAVFLFNTGFEWVLVTSSALAFLLVLYSLYKGWPRRAIWSLIFSIWIVLLLHQLTLAPALSRYQPVERLAASIPRTASHVYTSYAASDWANTLTFHLPEGTRITRLIKDKSGEEIQEILKHEGEAIVLIKEEEFERLISGGLSLRTLAEAETLGHGGLTIKLLRRPVLERLRVVQSDVTVNRQ